MNKELQNYEQRIENAQRIMQVLDSILQEKAKQSEGFNSSTTRHGLRINYYSLSTELTLKADSDNANEFNLSFDNDLALYKPIVNTNNDQITIIDGVTGKELDLNQLWKSIEEKLASTIPSALDTVIFDRRNK